MNAFRKIQFKLIQRLLEINEFLIFEKRTNKVLKTILTDKVKTHVFLLISFIAFILYVTEFAFVTQNYFSEKNRNRINILKHKNGTGESFDTRIWQDVYRDLKKKILHYFLKLDLIAYRKIII